MASVRSQQLRSLFHLVVTKCGWLALRGAIQYCPNCITDRPLEDLTFAPIQLAWACKVYQVEERDLRIAAEALWYAIRFAKEDPDLNPTAAELNDEIQYIQGKPSQALQDEARANRSKALRENVPEGERWEASILAFKEKELFPWGYGKYRTQVEKKPKRSRRKSNKKKEDAEEDENEADEDENEDADEETRKRPKRTDGKSKHKSSTRKKTNEEGEEEPAKKTPAPAKQNGRARKAPNADSAAAGTKRKAEANEVDAEQPPRKRAKASAGNKRKRLEAPAANENEPPQKKAKTAKTAPKGRTKRNAVWEEAEAEASEYSEGEEPEGVYGGAEDDFMPPGAQAIVPLRAKQPRAAKARIVYAGMQD